MILFGIAFEDFETRVRGNDLIVGEVMDVGFPGSDFIFSSSNLRELDVVSEDVFLEGPAQRVDKASFALTSGDIALIADDSTLKPKTDA